MWPLTSPSSGIYDLASRSLKTRHVTQEVEALDPTQVGTGAMSPASPLAILATRRSSLQNTLLLATGGARRTTAWCTGAFVDSRQNDVVNGDSDAHMSRSVRLVTRPAG